MSRPASDGAGRQFLKNAQIGLLILGALAILAGGSGRIAGVIIIAAVFVSYLATASQRR